MKNGATTLVGIIVMVGCFHYLIKDNFNAFSQEGPFQTEDHSKSGSTYQWERRLVESVDGLETIAIQAVNGKVDVEPNEDAEANEVIVEAVIKITKGKLWSKESTVMSTKERVDVGVERKGDSICFRTIQPKKKPWGIRSISIEYHAIVPQWMKADLKSINGQVSARGLESAVQVSTVNGKVKTNQCAGPVNATTVNGSIELFDLERPATGKTVNGSMKIAFARSPQAKCALGTTNGAVSISMPNDMGMDLDCSAVNGKVDLNNVAFEGMKKKNSARGKINQGGPSLEIHTVNGSVSIAQK